MTEQIGSRTDRMLGAGGAEGGGGNEVGQYACKPLHGVCTLRTSRQPCLFCGSSCECVFCTSSTVTCTIAPVQPTFTSQQLALEVREAVQEVCCLQRLDLNICGTLQDTATPLGWQRPVASGLYPPLVEHTTSHMAMGHRPFVCRPPSPHACELICTGA